MRKAKQKYQVGDKVQSHYGSKWYGIVVGFYTSRNFHNRAEYIYWIVPVIDIWGKPQHKLALHRLNGNWLEKSDKEFAKPEKFDVFVTSHSAEINGEVLT